MKKIMPIILVCVLTIACAVRRAPEELPKLKIGNGYPIILVHGFGGWGRDEILGYKYWGGIVDFQEELRKDGYEVYTAAIGPYSSNWDRACELYVYIKGGTVDYGEAHSKEFHHQRYGRTYPGLYQNWDADNKIHLIGHSQGGQTVRVLVQLLAQGSQAEIDAAPVGESSSLFYGGKAWVHSVTTISTPHDGTPLADVTDNLVIVGQRLVGTIAAITPKIEYCFDFKADQWGISREPGESFLKYMQKVNESAIWEKTKDIGNYDLSTEGAKKLNTWVKAQPNVFYFSWATEQTAKSPITGHQIPEIKMNPILFSSSFLLGSYTRNKPDQVVIDESWWQNDGLVSVISMDGPTIGSTDQIVPFNGIAQKGVWNYMGLLDSCDHADIIGVLRYPGEDCPKGYRTLLDWYKFLAALLIKLPK